MQWERHSILGVAIDALTLETAVAQVDTWLAQKETKFIATANAEMVMLAYKDPAFGQVLAAADLVLADGAGIVWAGEQLHKHFPARVAGIDFMTALVERAAQTGTKMYFFGGAPGVAAEAAQRLESRFGTLPIVGVRDGYFAASENDAIAADIRESGAQLLFAGLGVPKQEDWLTRMRPQLPGIVSLGVGGSFDVLSGRLKRAPLFWQKNRLEWLYRLALQPSRLRRMGALPQFMWQVKRSANRRRK